MKIVFFEKSTQFLWFFECLISVIRIFIERVIMLVVFLNAVKDFIANQSSESAESLGIFGAFWDIGSAILLAVLSLGAVGLVNLLVVRRKRMFFAERSNRLKPPEFFRDVKAYANFLKLCISSIIASLIMLWFDAAFAVPFFFLALLAAYPIKRVLGWRGGFNLWIGIFGQNILDLAILSIYFLSICVYFYVDGVPALGVGGIFILVLVPRVSFGFLANLLVRQESVQK